MKKNLIFIISLFFLGCVSQKELSNPQSCPEVFFSKDHRVYITSEEDELQLDNISYRAKFNNYNFNNSCLVENNILNASLSLLIVVQPLNAKINILEIPYYIAVLDNHKKIIDIEYYIFLQMLSCKIQKLHKMLVSNMEHL